MTYRIHNGSDYNAALKQRGSLIAITTMATLKANLPLPRWQPSKPIYRLTGRQCQGFMESIFELMGVDLLVPDHSTLPPRLGALSIAMPVVPTADSYRVEA